MCQQVLGQPTQGISTCSVCLTSLSGKLIVNVQKVPVNLPAYAGFFLTCVSCKDLCFLSNGCQAGKEQTFVNENPTSAS